MKWKYLAPIFSMVFILVFCSTASAAVEDIRTKNFTVTEGGKLNMDVNRASIEIDAYNGNTVKVMIALSVNTNDEEKAKSVFKTFQADMTQKNENHVVIESNFRGSTGILTWLKGKKMTVTYYIGVPAAFNLDLKTTTGSIKVNGVQGEVKTLTSSGTIELDGVKTSMSAHTASGDIKLNGCSGKIGINTSDGDILLGRVEGTVSAHTSVGDIEIKEIMAGIEAITSGGGIEAFVSRQPCCDCKLTTNTGSMTIKMANDIDVDIDAKTGNRKIKTEFEINGEQTTRKLKGKINNGGPTLYLRTTTGKIKIKDID
jgi:hypothetical protein